MSKLLCPLCEKTIGGALGTVLKFRVCAVCRKQLADEIRVGNLHSLRELIYIFREKP